MPSSEPPGPSPSSRGLQVPPSNDWDSVAAWGPRADLFHTHADLRKAARDVHPEPSETGRWRPDWCRVPEAATILCGPRPTWLPREPG